METAEAWPPKGGLPADEDPFDTRDLGPDPVFLPGAAPRDWWRINTERAFAISIILHLLLVIALLTVKLPARTVEQDSFDPLGLLSLMKTTPQDPPIPIQFFPAPGARAKEAPKVALPSDMNRKAHGGDPKLAVQAMPKAYPQAGIRDLDAGKSGPKVAAAPATQPPGSPAGEQERRLTDLVPRARALHDPPTAEEVAASRRLLGLPAADLNAITADSARRAVQTGGGGDDGGGYDRDGGFVDSGPLSFDTVGYDWGAYAAEMIRKIKRNWDVPALARYGVKGRITIRFYILKDGRVEAERILSGSGTPPFDNAAFQAIARSSAFRPLPDDLGHDREGVTVTFFYNLRPEDTEYAGRGRPR